MKIFPLLFLCFFSGAFANIPDSDVEEFSRTSDGKVLVENNRVWHGKGYSESAYTKLKSEIGWVYPINSTVQHVKKIQGTQNGYDVTYQINSLGQRVHKDEG